MIPCDQITEAERLRRYSRKVNPCRCQLCKAAKAASMRERREAGPTATVYKHGAYGYQVHRCRCDVCKAGERDRKLGPVPDPITDSVVPCTDDPRFVDDSYRVRRSIARLCETLDCPMLEVCRELGTGEDFGVYAGRLENDPERVAFRKQHRSAVNAGEICRNGHPLLVEVTDEETGETRTEPSPDRMDLEGVILPDSNLPKYGCLRCRELRDRIDAERRAHRPDYADLVG